jgi:hypothetical protein
MTSTYFKIERALAGRSSRKIGVATTALRDGTTLRVRYHSTTVIQSDGAMVTLRSGGWLTPTTKKRINDFLPHGWFLYQRNFAWFLTTPYGDPYGETLEFEDGMQIPEPKLF